jgi:hypothetical protein
MTYIRLGSGPHGLTTYTPPPPPPRRTRAAAAEVRATRAHPAAWAHALRLAGGDARRLTIHPDGSVTVRNK